MNKADAPNILLLETFFQHLKNLHHKELSLDPVESKQFVEFIFKRQRNLEENPVPFARRDSCGMFLLILFNRIKILFVCLLLASRIILYNYFTNSKARVLHSLHMCKLNEMILYSTSSCVYDRNVSKQLYIIILVCKFCN